MVNSIEVTPLPKTSEPEQNAPKIDVEAPADGETTSQLPSIPAKLLEPTINGKEASAKTFSTSTNLCLLAHQSPRNLRKSLFHHHICILMKFTTMHPMKTATQNF